MLCISRDRFVNSAALSCWDWMQDEKAKLDKLASELGIKCESQKELVHELLHKLAWSDFLLAGINHDDARQQVCCCGICNLTIAACLAVHSSCDLTPIGQLQMLRCWNSDGCPACP